MNTTNEQQNQKSESNRLTREEYEAQRKSVVKAMAKHQKKLQKKHIHKMNNNPMAYEEERKNSV